MRPRNVSLPFWRSCTMATPLQQPPQAGGGKRKGKAQYVQAKRARRSDSGGPRQLEPGLQGILITCNMNERKCVEEAYSLLNEYADDLYGPEKVGAPEDEPASRPLREEGRPEGQLRSHARGVFSRSRRRGVALPKFSPSRAWFADHCRVFRSECLHRGLFLFPIFIPGGSGL